jgi:hypothetical protein
MEHGVECFSDKSCPGWQGRYDYGKVELDILNTLGRKPPDGTSLRTVIKMVAEGPPMS